MTALVIAFIALVFGVFARALWFEFRARAKFYRRMAKRGAFHAMGVDYYD